MRNIFLVVVISFLFYSCSCNNNSEVIASGIPEPAVMNYAVTNVYPHDTTSYTEGLEFHNGFLYESGGDENYKGNSRLVRTDIKTGKDLQRIDLTKEYFGEGISILNGKIYQMTWKEHKCFVYDSATFRKVNEFTYESEGWGMTNDGKYLIMDNGGSNLYWRDPETFKVVKTLNVVDNNGSLGQINELELVNGFIYANVFETYNIVKIDTATGHVVAKADLSNILQKSTVNNFPHMDVLNGIAYDKSSDKFYITGKYWPNVFEVTFQ
jgi:Glutamine cyclotransferase